VILKISLWFALLHAIGGGWPAEPRETKDRLSPEAMARLVEQPMAALRERGLAAGDASFERLRAAEQARSGPASVRVADLLMGYGVELHYEWVGSRDRALLRAARERVDSAVGAYRAAFGPDHPEVALALHSFADLDTLFHGRATPAARAALGEALRIRRAALGPDNIETRATEDRLAELDAEGAKKERTIEMPALPEPIR
jgi:hypothetical protein